MHRSVWFLIAIVIALGIFFRVVNLDQKIVGGDECITQVRAAGYKGESYGVEEYQGESVAKLIQRDRVVTPEEMTRFQRIQTNPNAIDTIKATATGAPQHPPLYWLLIRFWMQAFGNSTNALRSLSVIFSVLTFPALYWLCWKLFSSAIVSSIAVALVAVSPVHIFQAQNARPYSLWILMIVVSSAALLRALRRDRTLNWVIYGVTLALSLYTYLFSIFVLISHGIYVIIREGLRKTQSLTAYLLTSGLVILSFLPWILVVFLNLKTADRMTSWTAMPVDFYSDLFWSWVKNLADVFLFWNIQFTSVLPLTQPLFVFSFGTALVILVTYAFYFLKTHSSIKEWVFLFALTSVTVLTLIAADLILGGRRAALGRYVYPSILGIQLTVAYLLGMKFPRSIAWRVITVVLLSCGVLSSTVGSQTEAWNGHSDFSLQSARIINQTTQPLVISDDDIVFGLMPLNTRLTPKVRWILVSQPEQVRIPDEFSDVFLYNASDELRSQLEKRYKFKSAYQYSYPGNFIWKASPPSILWKLDKTP
jgi:uncharacterized membrane protein